MTDICKPAADEHNPYFSRYIDRVPEGSDVLSLLGGQTEELETLLGGIDESGADYRYAPGKWSYKEVLGHLIDTERVFVTRALCAARGDTSPLPGFDQNDYVAAAAFDQRALAGLLIERRLLRQTTLLFFQSLDAEAMLRRGKVDGHPISARSILFTLAGHDIHHLAVLQERYLAAG